MVNQFKPFDNCSSNLNGRKATQDELDLIEKNFNRIDWVGDFENLISKADIIGASFELSKTSDHSGMGVDMEWMSPAEQIDEAFTFYPGLVVVAKGFMPVGICMQGSGDPYFLRIEDEKWKIYRVLHDFDSYDEKMIEFICLLDVLFEFGS